jgi:hypothetical protein
VGRARPVATAKRKIEPMMLRKRLVVSQVPFASTFLRLRRM